MLGIVIYEDNKAYMQKNINSINLSLANYDIDYRIYRFESYSDKLKDIINNKDMKKIYILDVEINGMSGLEIASMIREDDWESIIIFATAYDKYHNDIFYNRLMVLDFICKYNGYEKRLAEDIREALKILYKQKTFVFTYNHVVYRIPYNHICYIEKEPLIKRCIIHTLNNDFYVIDAISRLAVKLGNSFYRTHQSCIVNLNNIKRVDLPTNTIIFKNGAKTTLLTEKKKKDVRLYVGLDK